MKFRNQIKADSSPKNKVGGERGGPVNSVQGDADVLIALPYSRVEPFWWPRADLSCLVVSHTPSLPRSDDRLYPHPLHSHSTMLRSLLRCNGMLCPCLEEYPRTHLLHKHTHEYVPGISASIH